MSPPAAPPQEKTERPTVGAALDAAYRAVQENGSLKDLKAEADGLAKELRRVSSSASKVFCEQVAEMMKRHKRGKATDGEALEELGRLLDAFDGAAADAASLERCLRENCIPVIEAKFERLRERKGKIKPGEYEDKMKALSEELRLANVERRAVTAAIDLKEIGDKLEFDLGYGYLPRSLERDAKIYAATARSPGADLRACEDALEGLESVLQEYTPLAGSPSKAREFLETRKSSADPGLLPLLEGDLEKSGNYMRDAAPAAEDARAPGLKMRFRHDGHTVTSDAGGRKVLVMTGDDGAEVVFSKGYTLVVNAPGEDAVFDANGCLRQVRDAGGNMVQYVERKGAPVAVRARDSEGNWFFVDPDDPDRFAIIDRSGRLMLKNLVINRDGRIVKRKADTKALVANFDRIIGDFERDPELEEREVAHFNFERIRDRAAGARDGAEKRLAECSQVPREPEPATLDENREADIKAQLQLREVLVRNGHMKLARADRGAGEVEAELRHVVGSIPGKAVSPATFLKVRDAVKENHPANIVMNAQNTLVFVTRKKVYGRGTPDGLYTRLLQFPTEDRGAISVLLVHPEMLDAMVNKDFSGIGREVHARFYRQLWRRYPLRFVESMFTHWRLRLDMELGNEYDEKFLGRIQALPLPYVVRLWPGEFKRKLDALGKLAVFDRLVHHVTHAQTRAQVRQYWAGRTMECGKETREEAALMADHCAVRLGKVAGSEKKDELIRMHGDAFRILGTDLPTHLDSLDKEVDALRSKFLAKPSEATYCEYQKADVFRDIIRDAEKLADELWEKVKDRTPKSDREYYGECAAAFARGLRRKLIEYQGKAVEEALAIGMQSGDYYSHKVPTMWSLSDYIREAAKRDGHEAVLNALRSEVTPWGMIRAVNHLERIRRTLDRGADKVRAELARRKAVRDEVKEAFEIAKLIIDVGKEVGEKISAFSGLSLP